MAKLSYSWFKKLHLVTPGKVFLPQCLFEKHSSTSDRPENKPQEKQTSEPLVMIHKFIGEVIEW